MSTDETVPAAGSDRDSQMRVLKTQIAAADATGDAAAAKKLRGELDKLNAATDRATAAEGDVDASKAPPSGRTPAPAKSTTAKTS